MRRLALLLALALALLPVLSVPSRALDAQALFRQSENAVLVVYNLGSLGQARGQGSGFVVGDGRLAVTNYHVVERAASITVRTADGHEYRDVPVEGKYPERDLAVLRLPYRLPGLELAEKLPAVGQEVVAIGSPLGLERTLSTGVVSGLNREVRDIPGLIQITAPVSPGSSGGPVLDAAGRVVGVATLASFGGAAQNLNFAVPAALVRKLAGLHPAAEEGTVPAAPDALEIRKSPDGSIRIIQKRPKK